mmetsp:Transcript_74173/g.193507  ORF Transcript_74173/g.193507 Transcript_74173/m.193507 type:complete len:247 (-) Transcript_74173:420-1160(-)
MRQMPHSDLLLLRGRLLPFHELPGEELTQPEALDGRGDAGNSGGNAVLLLDDVVHEGLLQEQVLTVLEVEVRHAARAGLLELRGARLVLVVRADCLEELLPAVGDDCLAVLAVGSVTPDLDLSPRLELQGESDLGKICEALSGLNRSVHLVLNDCVDGVHREAKVRDEHHELVDHHILHHALSVALETFVHGLWGIEHVIAPDGQGGGGGRGGVEVLREPDVFAEIPVESHEHWHALIFRILRHLL